MRKEAEAACGGLYAVKSPLIPLKDSGVGIEKAAFDPNAEHVMNDYGRGGQVTEERIEIHKRKDRERSRSFLLYSQPPAVPAEEKAPIDIIKAGNANQ